MADNVIDMEQFQKKFTPKRIGLIVLALFIIIAAFSSVYMVDQKEEAVVLLLGQYNRITGPGLQFKLPFGIEKN
jgi:membrane protease subunit HflK